MEFQVLFWFTDNFGGVKGTDWNLRA